MLRYAQHDNALWIRLALTGCVLKRAVRFSSRGTTNSNLKIRK
jgi:hypothetical protein